MTELPEYCQIKNNFPWAWLGMPENKMFKNTYMETSNLNIYNIIKYDCCIQNCYHLTVAFSEFFVRTLLNRTNLH